MFSWGKDGGKVSEPRKVKLITTTIGDASIADANGATAEGKAPAREREVVLRGNALELTCGDGSVLKVLELQPLNKNVMSAKAFANGLRGEELTWVELEPLAEVVPA